MIRARVQASGADSAFASNFIGTGRPGSALGKASSTELNCPQGVTFDRAAGVVLIADTGNNRIVAVDKASLISKEVTIDFSRVR